MGRSITYRPTRASVSSASDRARYMAIASQIHDGPIDARVCVDRINTALDEIRRLEMEERDREVEDARAAVGDEESSKAIAHAKTETTSEQPETTSEQPRTPKAMTPSAEEGGRFHQTLLDEVPSPVRARTVLGAESPAERRERDSVALRCPGGREAHGMRTPVDERPFGTVMERRQSFERRHSGAHALELSPVSQRRFSTGSVPSPPSRIDASANAPVQTEYKEPAEGSTRKLKAFFESQASSDRRSGQTRARKNLADLLQQDETQTREQ